MPFEVVQFVERICFLPAFFPQLHALADYIAVVAGADRKFIPLRVFVHLGVSGCQNFSLCVLVNVFLLFAHQLLCFV